MNINIKEIFKSDLDPNNTGWWSKDKIDKLNFNFFQFTNGGMPGPAGLKGPDGDYGNMGPIGSQGLLGPIGPQGAPGISIAADWLEIKEKIVGGVTYPTVLFPKPPILVDYVEYTPIVLKTGYLNPNIEIAEDYRGSVKTVYTTPLNGGLQEKIALRLQHNSKGADFRLKLTDDNLDIEIGRIVTADSGFDLLNISDETTYEIGGVSYLKNTEDLISFGGNLSMNIIVQDFISHNQIKIQQGALPDYVLISEGVDGKVKWVDKKSIFGSFPIGSIISIREEDFNSSNFELNTTIIQPGPPYLELRIVYGRGKENTNFDGWYLCNGEKWKVENGINEFQTPNLSSFNYEIQSNGNGQNLVINGDNSPIIIGGSNIVLNAVTEGNGNYQIDMDVNSDDDTIDFGISNFDTEITRMVHIVYLENSELHWSNTEFAPPPPVNTSITLTEGLVSSAIACANIPNTVFTWSGSNAEEWETFNYVTTQHYLYINNTTNFAPVGWYKNLNGFTRYWNGSAFTQLVVCNLSPLNTAELVTDLNVFELNGEPSEFTGITYEIAGSTLFSTCVGIYNLSTGENASPGWYRDIEDGSRRYWDGIQFVGSLFTQNYIHLLIQTSYNTSSYLQGCSLTSSNRTTYIESNSTLPEYEYTIGDFVQTGNVLYVHNNWVSGIIGTIPLVSIVSQNAPSSTSKYRTAYNIVVGVGKIWADIDQIDGTLISSGVC